jgi:hypothetical protein
MNDAAYSPDERTLAEQQVRRLHEQGLLVWISDAWKKFGVSAEYAEKAHDADKRFQEVMGLRHSPEAYRKPVDNYLTIDHKLLGQALDHRGLENAARWDTRKAAVEYFNNRHFAHCQVLWSLESGALRACGARVGHDFEWIRATDWHDLKLDFAKPNVASTDGLTYRFVRVADPAALEAACADAAASAKIEAPPAPDAIPKPPFDRKQAKLLLMAKKLEWPEPPTEPVTDKFLRLHFRGVPHDAHVAVRRQVWPGMIRRGPKRRKKTAD